MAQLNLCKNQLDYTNTLNYMAFRFELNQERMFGCQNSVAVVERVAAVAPVAAVAVMVTAVDHLEYIHPNTPIQAYFVRLVQNNEILCDMDH